MKFSDINPTLWITSSDEDIEDEYRLVFEEREGKRERIRELRNGRETETKFKSSRRSVQEVYAGGVVTLETHSNVTYDYY